MKNKKTPVRLLQKKIGKYESGFLKKLLEQLRSMRAGGGTGESSETTLPAEYTAPVRDYRVKCGEVVNLKSQFAISSLLSV